MHLIPSAAGSEKKGLFGTSRSCPAPRPKSLTTLDNGHDYLDPDVSNRSGHKEDRISNLNMNISAGNKCSSYQLSDLVAHYYPE